MISGYLRFALSLPEREEDLLVAFKNDRIEREAKIINRRGLMWTRHPYDCDPGVYNLVKRVFNNFRLFGRGNFKCRPIELRVVHLVCLFDSNFLFRPVLSSCWGPLTRTSSHPMSSSSCVVSGPTPSRSTATFGTSG